MVRLSRRFAGCVEEVARVGKRVDDGASKGRTRWFDRRDGTVSELRA